ncbi:MAG TPA: alpha/beta hydrolase, partial [Saprospiraceae bacterium]|nr:alpha/beta hydrolase [Saprospiraceae bacterium]
KMNTEFINLEAYILDLLFVMDSLKINNAKFYGHSWGAMLATYFATKYPEKVSALILTGPGYLKLDKSYQNKIFANRMKKLSPEQRIRFDELSRINSNRLTVLEQNEISFLGAVFNTFDTTNWDWKYKKIQTEKNTITNLLITEDLERVEFDITDKVGQLNMPITLITCKEDPLAFLTTEYFKFAPKSKVKWLDNCGHFPMYEQPQNFYQMLTEAINNI